MKSKNILFNFIDSQINPKHDANKFVLNTIKDNAKRKLNPTFRPKTIKVIRLDTRMYQYNGLLFSHPQMELIAKMHKDIHGTELDIEKLLISGSK